MLSLSQDMHTHRFIDQHANQTLVVFHGMGSSKEDMVDLARHLAPHHNLLLLDGSDLSSGMRRYFKRNATGLDLDDLKRQAAIIADDLNLLRIQYGLGEQPFDAMGYSNGANMILGMVLENTFAFRKALILRPALIDLPLTIGAPTQLRLQLASHDQYLSASDRPKLLDKLSPLSPISQLYTGAHPLTEDDLKDAIAFFS
jgi:phospholipase/carboxylesterase